MRRLQVSERHEPTPRYSTLWRGRKMSAHSQARECALAAPKVRTRDPESAHSQTAAKSQASKRLVFRPQRRRFLYLTKCIICIQYASSPRQSSIILQKSHLIYNYFVSLQAKVRKKGRPSPPFGHLPLYGEKGFPEGNKPPLTPPKEGDRPSPQPSPFMGRKAFRMEIIKSLNRK